MPKNKKPKRTQKNLLVSLVVMQNGVILSERRYKVSANVQVVLSARQDTKSNIRLPNYHFYDQKENLIEIKRGRVYLRTSAGWEGVGTSRGEVIKCSAEVSRDQNIELERDDYFSLGYRDLRVLIKVTPKSQYQRESDPQPPGSMEGFSKFLVSSRQEKLALLAAACISFVLVGSLGGGLYLNKYTRPNSIKDIDVEYILPFVSPRLIQMAPELLKDNLEVGNLINNIVAYNSQFVDTLLGKTSRSHQNYIDSESRNIYRDMFDKAHEDFANSMEIQKSIDSYQKGKVNSKQVMIPAVAVESLDGTMNRALDKMNLVLEGAQKSLKLRRDIVPKFQHDPKHTFEAYQNVSENDLRAEALKDIKPWIKTTTEEQMYDIVEKWALRAELANRSQSHGQRGSEEAKMEPIGIVPGSKFLSFNVHLNELDDRYLDGIQGKGFTVSEKKPVKQEGLSGFIEPEKVEKFISLNKYQLQICYEIALRRDESSEGLMEWRWKVDSQGRIYDIELVANNINDDKMIKCIREKISQWRFPPPKNGAIEISFPFEFVSTKG